MLEIVRTYPILTLAVLGVIFAFVRVVYQELMAIKLINNDRARMFVIRVNRYLSFSEVMLWNCVFLTLFGWSIETTFIVAPAMVLLDFFINKIFYRIVNWSFLLVLAVNLVLKSITLYLEWRFAETITTFIASLGVNTVVIEDVVTIFVSLLIVPTVTILYMALQQNSGKKNGAQLILKKFSLTQHIIGFIGVWSYDKFFLLGAYSFQSVASYFFNWLRFRKS